MELQLNLVTPIQLTRSKKIIIDKNNIPECIPESYGVYFISRKHGKKYTPIYIGETSNLNNRLKDHLNNAEICDVLRGNYEGDKEIRQGTRFFHYGEFVAKQGQRAAKCISIIQKHMIEQAVEAGIPILNKNLTKVRSNIIYSNGTSDGRGWFPKKSIVKAK